MLKFREKVAYGLGDTASNICVPNRHAVFGIFLYRRVWDLTGVCWHHVFSGADH